MRGLRLALTCGVPGPWGEAAKKIFEYKKINYVPVAQMAGEDNADLVAWTGTRNAPIALYDDEPPRTGWYDILMLAERLNPDLPLLPAASEARLTVVGISNEICGEWGFGWARRTMMNHAGPTAGEAAEPPFNEAAMTRLRTTYSVSLGDATAAAHRAADILRMMANRLHEQEAIGSPYFVGDTITACDIYWTAFSSALEPLPPDVNPMPEWMRRPYENIGPILEAAKDPILLRHRDRIYARHLTLPLDF